MSRVTAFTNSIVTTIVNSDAYQQSALMDKWERMLHFQEYKKVELSFNMKQFETILFTQDMIHDIIIQVSLEYNK